MVAPADAEAMLVVILQHVSSRRTQSAIPATRTVARALAFLLQVGLFAEQVRVLVIRRRHVVEQHLRALWIQLLLMVSLPRYLLDPANNIRNLLWQFIITLLRLRSMHIPRPAMQNSNGVLHSRQRHLRLLLQRLPNILRQSRVRHQRLLLHAAELPGRHLLPRWRQVRERTMQRRECRQGDLRLGEPEQDARHRAKLRHWWPIGPHHFELLREQLQTQSENTRREIEDI